MKNPRRNRKIGGDLVKFLSISRIVSEIDQIVRTPQKKRSDQG
jgi:hypothetical protein